jgi:UDP-arabinose 4-epimerase
MHVLVTGGAGYIGSHTAKLLRSRGLTPVVLDNLSTGHADFARFGPFEPGDVRDEAFVFEVLKRHQISAVIHFAAKAQVGESTRMPDEYFSVNVGGMLSLLGAMRRAEVRRLVFSSSSAVYGLTGVERIAESHPLQPINPYGSTKRLAEEAIARMAPTFDLRWAALRYFNVIGADPDGELVERHEPETHVLPNLLRATLEDREFSLFGGQYPTPDGTAIRDYVDVGDLAFVHFEALQALDQRESLVSNVGSGRGTSVREMVTAVERTLNKRVRVKIEPPREGDPPRLVADNAHFLTWSTLGRRGFTPLADSVQNVVGSLHTLPASQAAQH